MVVQEAKKLMATEAYSFSPTLLKAKSTKFPSPLAFHHRVLGWTLALFCSCAFYIGPGLLLAPFIVYLTLSPKSALWFLFINLILIFYPHKEWPYIRSFFQLWYELFHFRHNITTETNKIFERQNHLSILAIHPHGVIPIHSFLHSAFIDQNLPSLYGVAAVTDAALRLPVLRQLLLWLSGTSANRKIIKRQMQKNDQNLYILPGGVAEIFYSRRMKADCHTKDAESNGRSRVGAGKRANRESINSISSSTAATGKTHFIKGKRYGLMKLALQTGSLIVPCYAFGGTEFYDQIATIGVDDNTDVNDHALNTMRKGKKESTSTTSKLSYLLQSISRRVKGGITFYWGQYHTPMPYPAEISIVLGDPIVPVIGTLGDETNGIGRNRKRTCKKIDDPTPEQVEELMTRYVDSMERLFDQYKHQAGYGNDILKVL